jgi:hypothetical protein
VNDPIPVLPAPMEPTVSPTPEPDDVVGAAPQRLTTLEVFTRVAELAMAGEALARDLGARGSPSSRLQRSSAASSAPVPIPSPRPPQAPPLAFFGGASGASAGGVSFALFALLSALLILARPGLGGVIPLRLTRPPTPLLVTRLQRPG